MAERFDAIVIGTGGIGSAALYHLANSGLNVVGLDRFPVAHDRGSSHGHTRIIRLAYFEHPDYVPLLRRAYTLWEQLQQRYQQQLYFPVGLLQVGPPDGVVLPGVRTSAKEHGLELESFGSDAAAFQQRFPGFALPAGSAAVFEAAAGYLLVEECVKAHCELAQHAGATLHTDAAVTSWSADSAGVTVETTKATYYGKRLVITAGPWASQILQRLQIPLVVKRKHLHWYPAPSELTAAADAPCYFYETPQGFFYGFPGVQGRGFKVAEHSGGTPITDPLADDRRLDPLDRQRCEQFLAECVPAVKGPAIDHAVCYYTVTPDEHFIVDHHPDYPHVAFAAGLSGHGFKFASALGETLAQLAIDGRAKLPIDFLRLSRPALHSRKP